MVTHGWPPGETKSKMSNHFDVNESSITKIKLDKSSVTYQKISPTLNIM